MKQGWEIKKLGEVCDFQGGSQPPKEEWIDEPREGYVRMLQIRDFTQSRSYDIEYVKESNRLKYCNEDDVLLGRYGASVGKVLTGLAGAYNVAIMKTMPNKDLLNKSYFKYFLESPSFQVFLQQASTMRAAQAGFSKEDIQDFTIPVPPREEQEKIVAELDCLSGIIERKREQLKQLDALAQSIFYQMFGDPITNEKGWEVKKWTDMLTIVNGKNQKTVENPVGAYPIYGSGGIMGYADKYLCPKNTIIIGRKGNINKPIFVKEPFWNVDTAFGLIADNIHIAPSFLFFYCRIFNFEQLNKAVTIPSLTKSDLLELNTPCPPLALQQEFADKIEAIEKQKELIRQSITQTEELFNSRMSYYFN